MRNNLQNSHITDKKTKHKIERAFSQSNCRSSDENLTFVAIVSCHIEIVVQKKRERKERSCLLTNIDRSTKKTEKFETFCFRFPDMKSIAKLRQDCVA